MNLRNVTEFGPFAINTVHTHTHTHTHARTPIPISYRCFRLQNLLQRFKTLAQNKEQLFPSTALTDWFLKQTRHEFTARYELNL